MTLRAHVTKTTVSNDLYQVEPVNYGLVRESLSRDVPFRILYMGGTGEEDGADVGENCSIRRNIVRQVPLRVSAEHLFPFVNPCFCVIFNKLNALRGTSEMLQATKLYRQFLWINQICENIMEIRMLFSV